MAQTKTTLHLALYKIVASRVKKRGVFRQFPKHFYR